MVKTFRHGTDVGRNDDTPVVVLRRSPDDGGHRPRRRRGGRGEEGAAAALAVAAAAVGGSPSSESVVRGCRFAIIIEVIILLFGWSPQLLSSDGWIDCDVVVAVKVF